MKNLYDIREEENLYYIFSKDNIEGIERNIDTECAAVFVSLYYMDSIDYYLRYLKQLDYDIYIISSNEVVLQYIDRCYKRDNFILLSKRNRGRDISALLVTCREVISRYKYFCFIHDKKHKEEYSKSDTDLWITNLWGNMLASSAYVQNILNLFEKNSNLGLLVPPEPIGDYCNIGEGLHWGGNFENTWLLKENLGLKCDMVRTKSPITLGTVFWSRTVVLKKLFDLDWKYEDFDEEPLPRDGTLSHAIERILGYVAQDSGYDVATVMTTDYASVELSMLYRGLAKAFPLLEETHGVHNFKELYEHTDKRKQITDFCSRNTKVYLFGAGKRGVECLRLLRNWGYEPDGFLVTSLAETDIVEGLKLLEFEKLIKDDSTGIIITAAYNVQQEIIHSLELCGFHNYITYLNY